MLPLGLLLPMQAGATPSTVPPPPPAQPLGQVIVGPVGDPVLEGFIDECGNRTTVLGNPFKMGHRGNDERLRDAVCDAYDELHDLDVADMSPGRVAAEANAIARRSVGGSDLSTPPLANSKPIGSTMQACHARQLALAGFVVPSVCCAIAVASDAIFTAPPPAFAPSRLALPRPCCRARSATLVPQWEMWLMWPARLASG